MKFTGENVLAAPVQQVWDALLDPAVLVRTIPGCERLEETGEHSYAMTVTAGVAAIKGTYDGTCTLHDLQPHESLTMEVQGAGAPGTIGAQVAVALRRRRRRHHPLHYDADAVVGGMIGGVGQRMLTSVSRRWRASSSATSARPLRRRTPSTPAGRASVAQPARPSHGGSGPGLHRPGHARRARRAVLPQGRRGRRRAGARSASLAGAAAPRGDERRPGRLSTVLGPVDGRRGRRPRRSRPRS